MVDYMDHMLLFRKEYYRNLDPVCRRWELTHNEMDVILFLTNHPGKDRASDIVACRAIAKSHVSQSVTALEARGFLCRTPDTRDRRTVHLQLTEAAQPMIRDAVDTQYRFFRTLRSCLTDQDVENWHIIVDKLRAAIEQMEQTNQ